MFSSALIAALAVTGAVARPFPQIFPASWGPGWVGNKCMTAAQAKVVVNNYGLLLSNYSNASANAFLASDFTDYSESVNTLIDTCPSGAAAAAETIPLLSASFTSRTEFEEGQGEQPGITFEPQEIWNTCNTAITRWETPSTGTRVIVGNLILEVVPGSGAPGAEPWIISVVYSEFDSGAWLQNLYDQGACTNLDPSTSEG